MFVIHSHEVATSSVLRLPQNGVDAEDSSPFRNFCLQDPVLPPHVYYPQISRRLPCCRTPPVMITSGSALPSGPMAFFHTAGVYRPQRVSPRLQSTTSSTLRTMHSTPKAEADTQRSMKLFTSDYAQSGLTTNTNKTVVIPQPPPRAAYSVPPIHVDSGEQNIVDNVVLLCNTHSHCIKVGDKVAQRILEASQGFSRL
nr:unnamed protein product [Spirometra erinaceieuropaei]